MRRRKLISRVWLVLLVSALCGCVGMPMGTLAFGEMQNFSVKKVKGDERTLAISALSGSSSLAISRVDIVTEGDTITILPRAALGGGNLSGDLYVKLKVPARIHRVLFGSDGYEIWPHVPPPPDKWGDIPVSQRHAPSKQ